MGSLPRKSLLRQQASSACALHGRCAGLTPHIPGSLVNGLLLLLWLIDKK
jgi:hypothetical protein